MSDNTFTMNNYPTSLPDSYDLEFDMPSVYQVQSDVVSERCAGILLCAGVANANSNTERSRTLSECEMDRGVDAIKEQQTEREIKRRD